MYKTFMKHRYIHKFPFESVIYLAIMWKMYLKILYKLHCLGCISKHDKRSAVKYIWSTSLKSIFLAESFSFSTIKDTEYSFEFYSWTIDREATHWTAWPHDSLPARKVSFHRSEKTLTQHCSSLFPLFQVRVAIHLAFRVRRAATWPLSPEWRKTIWPPDTSF